MIAWGARIAAVFEDAPSKTRFVQRLLAVGGASLRGPDHMPLIDEVRAAGPAGYVSQGTTLVSGMTVLENLFFPLQYHEAASPSVISREISLLCRLCSLGHAMLAKEVGTLGPLERIQASFLQAAVTGPEVLVCDQLFDSIGQRDQVAVSGLIGTFHRLYPLRRSLYLGYVIPPDQLYSATSVVRDTMEQAA